MLQVVVFVVLELTFVLWYLSAAAVRRLIYSRTIANLLQCYAPINVNPVGKWGGGAECGQGVGIWQILNFFDQISQGGKRKVNQVSKKPPPQGKNLNKQYYNTI